MKYLLYSFIMVIIMLQHSVLAVDRRNVLHGHEIPSESYVDMPYVTVTDEGSWLCTLTTSSGYEHDYMNHIVYTLSYDQGQSWTPLQDIEPASEQYSSWAVPLQVPGGRIYVFYNFNKHRLTGLQGVKSGPFAFRYSDDHGKTWSAKRYEVPLRQTKIDRENSSKGKYQFFWSVDKPIIDHGAAYIAITKQTLDWRGEGFILKSENILTETDPTKIEWTLLPEGETGIFNPELSDVQTEHNLVALANGDLYVVNRTTTGHPTYSISRDGGKTFSLPKPMQYKTGGFLRNPRACPKIHRTQDGKFLFWYHNNGQKSYQGRNPVWLTGGLEVDGDIQWSQPEILFYNPDRAILGMSYPDYIEQDGRFWMTETEKFTARVHELDQAMLEGLWQQGVYKKISREGLIFDSDSSMLDANIISFPKLPHIKDGGGFTFDFWVCLKTVDSGQVILDSYGPKRRGVRIETDKQASVRLTMDYDAFMDGTIPYDHSWSSDPNVLKSNQYNHIVFIVDGDAKIVTNIINGVLSDGDENKAYGWGRLHPYLNDVNDTYRCKIAPSLKGKVVRMRIYEKALLTSQAIANYHADRDRFSY